MQRRLEWWEIELLHKHVLKMIWFFMVNREQSGNKKLASFAMWTINFKNVFVPMVASLFQDTIKKS